MWGGFDWFPCIILLGVAFHTILRKHVLYYLLCVEKVGILVVSINYGIGNHEVFGLLLVSNDDIIN